ncbi:hypothetical protein A3K63_03630 [Candidatus Micrarchaeota archaeon RBG_16_49_10]|nr:MAG: hypothetical protein A3K63_03630 [Candidatus Micrarchaeota archaeon RBG_16_49_10]
MAASLIMASRQVVEVTYFTSPGCLATEGADRLMVDLHRDFGERLEVETVTVDLSGVVEQRGEYKVYGVPTILVDGVESSVAEAKVNICRNFIIKPGACYR